MEKNNALHASLLKETLYLTKAWSHGKTFDLRAQEECVTILGGILLHVNKHIRRHDLVSIIVSI